MAKPTSKQPDRRRSGKSWQPLSARHGGSPIDQTWQEGIPPWLKVSVRDWLRSELADDKVRRRLYARLHHQEVEDDLVRSLTDRTEMLSDESLLDWVDGVLHINLTEIPRSLCERHAKELDTFLREGHSVWKVSHALDSLERRQDMTVTQAAHRATQVARATRRPASAVHLEKAWAAVYGLHPEPSKAFGEAILAVEAAAVPAIVPNHVDATLGHVLGQLKNQAHLYEIAITDKTGALSNPEVVIALVKLLWEGHTDRHEGNRPAIPITQEAAEMAVHAAAVLVQWFSTTAIRRRSSQM